METVIVLLFIMAVCIFPLANSVKDDGEVVTIQPMFWLWLGLWVSCSAILCWIQLKKDGLV